MSSEAPGELASDAPVPVEAPPVEGPRRAASTAAERASAPNDAAARLAIAPRLAGLAVVAGVVDLVWNRMAYRLVDPAHRDVWIPLARHGQLPRNLAAIAGLFAMTAGIGAFLRMAGFTRVSLNGVVTRLSLATFAGLLLPAMAAAVLVPQNRLPALLVMIALATTNAITALFASSSLAYRRVGAAWPSILAGICAFAAMSGLFVASARDAFVQAGVAWIGLTSRHVGELTFLAVPTVLLFDRDTRDRLVRHRRRTIAGVVVALLVLAAGLAGEVALDASTYARFAYGAFRLSLLPAWATVLYAVPIAIGAGLATVLVASEERRQLGLGLALWVVAGLSPRTPIGMIEEVLAAVLLARAAMAAHPDGRDRARRAW